LNAWILVGEEIEWVEEKALLFCKGKIDEIAGTSCPKGASQIFGKEKFAEDSIKEPHIMSTLIPTNSLCLLRNSCSQTNIMNLPESERLSIR
jgi:hypothetical protein